MVCFILRGHVWYVTCIFLLLLFILVGKIYPPMHARTFSLTSFETQSSSCDYITESDFLLSGIAMVSYNVLLCWAQLVIFFYFYYYYLLCMYVCMYVCMF